MSFSAIKKPREQTCKRLATGLSLLYLIKESQDQGSISESPKYSAHLAALSSMIACPPEER